MRAPMAHSLRRLLELVLATMPMTFVASCAPETAPGQLPETIQSPGNKSKSDALRTTLVGSIQRDASEAYAAQSWGSFVRMENPAQKFVVTIDAEGLSVMPDEDDWQLTMRTVAMGCSGAMVYVADDVTIRVDDDGAAYPLTVDPILWIQQAKLVAGDGAMTDEFGNSIALSGDTALVTRSAASFHWV